MSRKLNIVVRVLGCVGLVGLAVGASGVAGAVELTELSGPHLAEAVTKTEFVIDAEMPLGEHQAVVSGWFVDVEDGTSTFYDSTCDFQAGKLWCPEFGWTPVEYVGRDYPAGLDVYTTKLNAFQGAGGFVYGHVEFEVLGVTSFVGFCFLSADDHAECAAWCASQGRGGGVAHSGFSQRTPANPNGAWACNMLACICDVPGYGVPPGLPEAHEDLDPGNGDGDGWCWPPPPSGMICM